MEEQIQMSKSDNFIRIMVHLRVVLTEEDGVFVAECPILDVATQGDTREHALEMIRDAVQLFLVSCYEMNTLDDVLNECGFEKSAEGLTEQDQENGDHINVPIDLVVARGMGLVSGAAPC